MHENDDTRSPETRFGERPELLLQSYYIEPTIYGSCLFVQYKVPFRYLFVYSNNINHAVQESADQYEKKKTLKPKVQSTTTCFLWLSN